MTRRSVLATLTVGLWLFAFSTSVFADSFTFNTDPAGGDVAGPAGSTVGWGYSITNQSLTEWLVTTNLSADAFVNGTPNALFDFPILAPGSSIDVPFDALNNFGLYELTWDAGAPDGFTNSGLFDVSADWYDGDPFAGGNFLESAIDQTASFSATVSPAGSTPVPEPSSLSLLGAGLGTIYMQKRKNTRRGQPQ